MFWCIIFKVDIHYDYNKINYHILLDVGTRFYTYIWTMSYAMEAIAKTNKSFIVFDRPNPLNADTVEGCPNNIDGGLVGRLFKKHKFGIPQR